MNASGATTIETSSFHAQPTELLTLPKGTQSTLAGAGTTRKTRKPRAPNGVNKLDEEMRKSERLTGASGTPETKSLSVPESTRAVSAEILPMDSHSLSGNLKTDLCHSMTLIHSTAKDLRSCMSEMISSKAETWEFGQGLEKMKTVGFVAGQINQLMRTQLKVMKEYRQVVKNEAGGSGRRA